MWILTQYVRDGIWESALLTDSGVIVMLLVWDPTLRSKGLF